jgi:Reverse transcriptase (RNA-dependent DNA polymerase).
MLTSSGFKKFNNDPCICMKYKRNRVMTIIAVYVEDLFVFTNNCSEKGILKGSI